MNRWGRIVGALAGLATAGWIAGGWIGFAVADDATLARHTLFVFTAALGLVLVHGWVGVYLVVFSRLAGARLSLSPDDGARLAAARRLGVTSAAVAIIATLAQFAISNALYPSRLDAEWHALGGLATAIVLVAAWGAEMRALAVAGRIARAARN